MALPWRGDRGRPVTLSSLKSLCPKGKEELPPQGKERERGGAAWEGVGRLGSAHGGRQEVEQGYQI